MAAELGKLPFDAVAKETERERPVEQVQLRLLETSQL